MSDDVKRYDPQIQWLGHDNAVLIEPQSPAGRFVLASDFDRLQSALADAELANKENWSPLSDERQMLRIMLGLTPLDYGGDMVKKLQAVLDRAESADQQLTAAQARIAELERDRVTRLTVPIGTGSSCGCSSWADCEGNQFATYCDAHRPKQPPTAGAEHE